MSENAPVYQTDAELQGLLDIADASGRAISEVDAFGDMLVRDEQGTLLAVSRELARLMARRAESEEYVARVIDDHRAAMGPVSNRIAQLDGIVKDVLLSRRRRNPDVKSLSIPGFGEDIGFTDLPPVADAAAFPLLERLGADEWATFVEERPHLKTASFRAHLDALLSPAKAGLDKALTPEERAQRLADVAAAIGGPLGVTYRPERISVKGPVD